MAFRERIKWMLFPGLNLHARLRRRVLPPFFGRGNGTERQVLDAGCGNGMLAYESYLKGNRVMGISIKEKEIEGCRRLFENYLQINKSDLTFTVHNLYDAESLGGPFDEIICTEVMEHIVDDASVCRSFWNLLKPGGALHLCCPNADHPDHQAGPIDENEEGGHVRAGYTLKTYHELLEPVGFRVTEHLGLGGPIRQAFNKRIIRTEIRFGYLPAFLLFLLAQPFLPFDSRTPRIPYSLYVKAEKPSTPDALHA